LKTVAADGEEAEEEAGEEAGEEVEKFLLLQM